MRIDDRHEIAAPPPLVWHLLTDDLARERWMPGLVATTYPQGRPTGDPVGTRFRETLEHGASIRTYEGRILAHVPGRLIAIRLEDAEIEMEISYRLGRASKGTLLTYAGDFHLKGIMGSVLMSMAEPAIARRVRAGLEELKRIAEATVV